MSDANSPHNFSWCMEEHQEEDLLVTRRRENCSERRKALTEPARTKVVPFPLQEAKMGQSLRALAPSVLFSSQNSYLSGL